MKKLLIIPILFYSIICSSQTILTLTGQTFSSTYTVPHSSPTTFAFTNNSLTSSNTSGYQLNAGDEIPGSSNDYLDGSVITGNRITYTGAPSGTHGIFVGYKMDERGNNKLPNQRWWLKLKDDKFFVIYEGHHSSGGMHHEELYMDMDDPIFCVEKIAGTIDYLRAHR